MKLGWLIVLIYLILAYKNPFSNRSLVPNLEPYPDSLYYSYPAWSWLHRNGFGMNYGADSIPTIVPPGYGWWLTPFFAIFDDVRGFYVANLVLQVGTIIFFLATIKNLIGRNKISPLIMGLGGMVLVTNFYFYNLPGLLMAENPTVFLVAVGIYLLSGKVTKLKSILAGLMGIIFWLIKLSNIPLGLSFLLLYGVKIGQEKGRKYLGYYLGSVLLQTAVYFLIFFDKSILSNSNNVNSPPAFSLNYFRNNFNFYLRSLLGGETNYLWYRQKFISPLLGILSVVGGITAIFQKKYRLSGIYYLVILGSLVGFMSLFITPDARYIFSLLPILIILALITLAVIAEKSDKVGPILIGGLFLLTLFVPQFSQSKVEPTIISLKRQVGLNFRHSEDPWNYNAIAHINSFLIDKPGAYIGTFLPPFYVEMFRQGDYHFLPISLGQEFSGPSRPLIDHIYQADGSIIMLYQRLLSEGKEVYITNAYVNNVSAWPAELEVMKQKYAATLVSEGCMGSCDIYKLFLVNK